MLWGTSTPQHSFRTAVPAQMPEATDCGQAPAAFTHTNTCTEMLKKKKTKHKHIHTHSVKLKAEESSVVYTSLQLIQRQWAAPAVSKTLTVIT